MKLNEIRVGDVVVLNSGGPAMTVSGIIGDAIRCQWQNDGFTDESSFDVACLTRKPVLTVHERVTG